MQTTAREQKEMELAQMLEVYTYNKPRHNWEHGSKDCEFCAAENYLLDFLTQIDDHDCHMSPDDGCEACEMQSEIKEAMRTV